MVQEYSNHKRVVVNNRTRRAFGQHPYKNRFSQNAYNQSPERLQTSHSFSALLTHAVQGVHKL